MSELTLVERRQKILDLLHQNNKVVVSQLSEMFGVSEVCIRNDLADLESKGHLSRVHGGAVAFSDSYYNMSLTQRSNTNRASKEEIANTVADMIHDNQSVMMNAGTTTLAVMKKLTEKKNLNIVTNSVVLALEGAKYPNLHITLLGGEVNAEYQFVYGTLTLSQLDEYKADVLILSADGIEAENGITTYYDKEADICRKMIKQSSYVIAALDCTKIGKVTYKKISDVDKIDSVVTNVGALETTVKQLKKHDVNVIVAKSNNDTKG